MSNLEAGWYPHPAGGIGYYDGSQWTEHRPPDRQAAITRPAVGWALVVVGAFVAAAAFLPWVTGLNGVISRNGLDGGRDGVLTLFLGIVLAAVGLAIGLRQGYIWAPVLALFVAGASFVVFLIDYDRVEGQRHVSVGFGLWLTGIAAGIGVIAALAGLVLRSR